MFKAALPVLVSVTFWVALLPTATPLNATADGLIESCAAVGVPDPVRAILRGDPGALLVIETVPLALPADVGAYVAVNETVWPGFKACGGTADMVKPAPEIESAVIETAAVPVFDSVTGMTLLLPTRTLPKLTLSGFAVKLPCMPVPASAIVSGVFGALLITLRLPDAEPAAVGAN
jgi:hypothetical protein